MFFVSNKSDEYPIKCSNYPDGSLLLQLDNIHFRPSYIRWHYENDAELFTLICLRKHWPNQNMVLHMPYCPHARMDRVKAKEDVFTLKHFADVINWLGFSEVIIEDAHSNVAPALLNNVTNYSPVGNIEDFIGGIETQVLFFPDEGAMKRYSTMFDLPYAFGIKNRDWKTGKILGLDIVNKELVQGKNVLIIDDICSRGSTFYHAANALKEAGAKNIYLYVTHAEHTMVEGDMYNQDVVKHIFTTNSIFKREWDVRGKVTVMEV